MRRVRILALFWLLALLLSAALLIAPSSTSAFASPVQVAFAHSADPQPGTVLIIGLALVCVAIAGPLVLR